MFKNKDCFICFKSFHVLTFYLALHGVYVWIVHVDGPKLHTSCLHSLDKFLQRWDDPDIAFMHARWMSKHVNSWNCSDWSFVHLSFKRDHLNLDMYIQTQFSSWLVYGLAISCMQVVPLSLKLPNDFVWHCNLQYHMHIKLCLE